MLQANGKQCLILILLLWVVIGGFRLVTLFPNIKCAEDKQMFEVIVLGYCHSHG